MFSAKKWNLLAAEKYADARLLEAEKGREKAFWVINTWVKIP